LKIKKDTNGQVLIKFQQNELQQEAEKFFLTSINLLFLFGLRKNCLSNGRSQPMKLFK